jgi:kumamolisin
MGTSEATPIPENYVRLEGSERHPSLGARLLGPADPTEQFSVTIVLRRRLDGDPMPDFDYFLKTPPSQRRRLSDIEYASKYGASAEDIKKVTDFAVKNELKIKDANATSRSVVVSGSVDQMSKAFGVTLGIYEHEVVRGRGDEPVTETYRGRGDGFIHVPKDLAEVITGIFGLDNRSIGQRNNSSADPPNTTPLSVETVTQLYNFPPNNASGQTIGILFHSETENLTKHWKYNLSDINASFGGSPPTIRNVMVKIPGNPDPIPPDSPDREPDHEVTMDIVIAAKAAPRASIAVYFTPQSEQGYVTTLIRVAHPELFVNEPNGDVTCNVLSSSFYISNGDDTNTLTVTEAFVEQISDLFKEAASRRDVTICVASGDHGTASKVGDGRAHVQYPGSDPNVLSVGGTTIGGVNGTIFDEYVWNDPKPPNDPIQPHYGTTGGGVSDHFPLPLYQTNAGVPKSINDNARVGRGVPDVAANASLSSAYTGITFNGKPFPGSGTSASAPLWAGLIARINAALGTNVGFINPILYDIGSKAFNDIIGCAGPADNSNAGVPGYPTGIGWDACTGWGSPNGIALLEALRDWIAHNP